MKAIFCIFANLVGLTILGQEINRNANWTIGYSPALVFNFNQINLNIDTLFKGGPSLTFGSSCISNLDGKLQFFSNGFYVYDNEGWPIDYPNGNWDSINCPLGTKLRSYYNGNGYYNQMSIILPKKNNSYYVFTTGMSDAAFDDTQTGTDFRFDVLSYHIVDMDANEGKGKVIEKNKILMQDTRLSHNRMSAVRHANGRDWWLVKPHKDQHIFYTFRVTPDSIYGPFQQDLLLPYSSQTSARGQSCFSSDGEWYAHTQFINKGVYINKFDRCKGKMEFYHFYPTKSLDTSLSNFTDGVSFSSNSKFVYLNSEAEIFQAELSDTSINSVVNVFSPDSIQLSQIAGFNMMQLAPNDKIYIGNSNGVQKYMTFIELPDTKGLGCDVKFRGLFQPYTNILAPPNMPFYGLGALKDSPCDTIKPPYIPVTEIKIYPNPVSEKLTLEFPQGIQNAEVAIFNMLGQRVHLSSHTEILNNKMEISVRHLARALYSIKIITNDEQFVGKFVRE